MNTFALFVAMLAPAIFVAAALAQTQVPPPAERSSPPPGGTTPAPKRRTPVEGRIENVDPSRRAITLSDGTKLVTPVGAVLQPGVVTEGMLGSNHRGPGRVMGGLRLPIQAGPLVGRCSSEIVVRRISRRA